MKPRSLAGCILSLVLLTYGCNETAQVNTVAQATPGVISTPAHGQATATTAAEVQMASPELRWKIELGRDDFLWAAPAVADGAVYMLDEDYLYAIDTQSGVLLWQFMHDVELFGSTTPLVNNGTIYFTIPINTDFNSQESGAIVYAVDTITHEQKWRRSVAEEDVTDPVLLGDTLFFAGRGLSLPEKPHGGHVYAVHASTGVLKWSFSTIENVESLFADKNSVYFGDGGAYAYSLDALSGHEKWKTLLANVESSVLAVANDAVYALSSDTKAQYKPNRLYALNSATGKQQWVYEKGDSRLGKLLVVNEDIYLTTQPILVNCLTDPNCLNSETHKGSVAIIDTATGKEKALFKLAGAVGGIPIVRDSSLYLQVGVLTPRGHMLDDEYIMAIDSTSGQEIWRYLTDDIVANGQPVLNGDSLYFWEGGALQAINVP